MLNREQQEIINNNGWDNNNSIPIMNLETIVTLFASITTLLKPSTLPKIQNRDKGNPYLNPLDGLKNVEFDPLINTTMDTYFTTGRLKPTCKSISPR